MNNTILINAAEIAEELGVSQAYAYKLIRELNAELKSKGYFTIGGKVSRQFFNEKLYGLMPKEGAASGSVQG